MVTDGNRDRILNSVLILSGSVFDYQIGAVLTLLTQEGSASVLDKKVYGPGLNFLLEQRINHVGEDFLRYALDDKYKDQYEVYKKYLLEDEKSFTDVIKLSPVTQVINFIKSMEQYRNTFHCTVQYKFDAERDAITAALRKVLNTTPSVNFVKGEIGDFDMALYARIIMPDIHNMDALNDPEFKTLTVLNYGSNLQLIEDEIVLIPEFIARYSYTNRIEVMDSFKLNKGDK